MIDRLCHPQHELRVARVDPDKPLGIHYPKHVTDCGWDLEAMEDIVIPPMESRDVPVNVRLHLPPNVWGLMLARSSIAKRNLQVEAGVMDNGYRGEVFVVLRNMQLPMGNMGADQNSIKVAAGERVAQMVFYKDAPLWLTEATEIDERTSRGTAGFGSTGA